ncbi:MAG TPA: hypothetical protein PLX54_07975 [Candidatus Fermentibacter daniensis]|nr:hypothetical protein [Candidatus Fermentibacter daniensis]HPK52292.1 hypothetical protein [Candidatus Fermentibacter daniensis]
MSTSKDSGAIVILSTRLRTSCFLTELSPDLKPSSISSRIRPACPKSILGGATASAARGARATSSAYSFSSSALAHSRSMDPSATASLILSILLRIPRCLCSMSWREGCSCSHSMASRSFSLFTTPSGLMSFDSKSVTASITAFSMKSAGT